MLANALPELAAALGASQSDAAVDRRRATRSRSPPCSCSPPARSATASAAAGALIAGIAHLRRRLAARRRSATRPASSSRCRALTGHRRRADHARHAVDDHQRVPARGAGQGGRHLGRLRRRRRHPRHARVGRAARAVLLGLDLLRHRRRSRSSTLVAIDRSSCPTHAVERARRSRPARRRALGPRHRRCSCSASSRAPTAAGPTRSRSIGARRRRRPRSSAFVLVELRTDDPLLDPRLFRHRGFATGSASLFLQFFAMFGFFFVSLQFLQLVLGYSTLDRRASRSCR